MEILENRNELLKLIEKDLIIAEIGVFEGEFSKIIFNECNPSKLYLVDLFNGYFGSGDKDGNNYHYVQLEDEMEKIKNYFSNNSNVIIKKLDSISFLNSLDDNYLDMVYIDADHSYNSVFNDLKTSFKKVKNGGYICGHDYVKNTEAEKAVNDFCEVFNLEIKYLTKDGCPSFLIVK
jgi:hypothetical protein